MCPNLNYIKYIKIVETLWNESSSLQNKGMQLLILNLLESTRQMKWIHWSKDIWDIWDTNAEFVLLPWFDALHTEWSEYSFIFSRGIGK